MKSYFQATAFLLALSSLCIASITTPDSVDPSSANVVSAAGSTGQDHLSVSFNLPGAKLSNKPLEELEVNLLLQPSDSGCRPESVYINGVPLALVPTDASSWTGPQTFPSASFQSFDGSEFEASLLFKCMRDQAALLSVGVTRVAGKDVSSHRPGFTVSFNQSVHPRILHLTDSPQSDLQDVSANEDTWLSPTHGIPEGLDQEIYRLDILREHLNVLKGEIHKQERAIMAIWKAEFSKCSTIGCYLRTAVEKAPILARLIANHFRHHSNIDLDFFHKGNHVNCSEPVEQLASQPSLSEEEHDELEEAGVPYARPSISAVRSVDIAAPTPTVPSAQPEVTAHAAEPSGDKEDPSTWMHGGRPPWWSKPGGRPPWAKPGWHGGPPPWVHTDHSRPPFNWQSHVPQDLVPELTPQQIWRIHLIGAMIGLLVVLLLGACVFTCIKHKARIFRDPRRRVELMTRREEWIKRRAFRKAACKHRFRTFLKTLRSLTTTTSKSEDEEKEVMVATHDEVVVGREINNIRAAHQFIGDMLRAEEGQSNFATTTRHQRSASGSESLPSYRSGPPGYASGQEGDISVIDGFTGYTPSNTDDTPNSDSESSIVDLSPRMSLETQRTS